MLIARNIRNKWEELEILVHKIMIVWHRRYD